MFRGESKELKEFKSLSDLEILEKFLKNDEAKATISNLVNSHVKLVADTGISRRGGSQVLTLQNITSNWQ